jgi:phospholipase D1/2
VHGVGSELAGKLGGRYEPAAASHQGAQSGQTSSPAGGGTAGAMKNRYDSFAGQKSGNDVKWYVDGCGYMFAVSKALLSARESIWILDCEWILTINLSSINLTGWLSPELYLRRPPMENEQFRVDRMLQAAAERGVRVNVIVYKEVEVLSVTCGASVLTVCR